jgi:hypothetical protein
MKNRKMVYILLLGIIGLIIFSIRYYKKVENDPNHRLNQSSANGTPISIVEDSPISFGYKCMWIAVKTDDKLKLADIIGLKNPKKCNWKSGIDNAYVGSVFISPVVDNWTFAVGLGLPSGDSKESIDEVKILLKRLSGEFGEAHFFCTHRVVEYHCWIKSTNGKIDRVYSYLGESGENIEISGNPTEIERTYNLIDTFSEEAKQDDYWDREDLTFPDEEIVMEIANNWGVGPGTLDNRQDIEGLGLIGKRK